MCACGYWLTQPAASSSGRSIYVCMPQMYAVSCSCLEASSMHPHFFAAQMAECVLQAEGYYLARSLSFRYAMLLGSQSTFRAF